MKEQEEGEGTRREEGEGKEDGRWVEGGGTCHKLLGLSGFNFAPSLTNSGSFSRACFLTATAASCANDLATTGSTYWIGNKLLVSYTHTHPPPPPHTHTHTPADLVQ